LLSADLDLPLDALGASLFDASEDCISVVGIDGTVLAMNVNGVRQKEIDDFAALRGGPWTALWPERHHQTIEDAIELATRVGSARFVADRPTPSGVVKTWDVVLFPMFETPGAPTRLVAVTRDITDRLLIESEKALLAQELAHRIRNMFAVVNGVISLSARSADPAVLPFADALRARLTGLWRAISYVSPPELAEHGFGGEHTVIGLLHVLLAPYGDLAGPDRRVTINGPDTPIGRSATTSLALIANELATNALKYGSLGQPEGHVTVETRLEGEHLVLIWTEMAPTPDQSAASPSGDGFGSVLLEKAVRQLGGELTRAWLPAGLAIHIRLAVERIGR